MRITERAYVKRQKFDMLRLRFVALNARLKHKVQELYLHAS